MKTKKVTITLTTDIIDKVKNEAKKEDRNISNMILVILKKYFK